MFLFIDVIFAADGCIKTFGDVEEYRNSTD